MRGKTPLRASCEDRRAFSSLLLGLTCDPDLGQLHKVHFVENGLKFL